MAAILIVEDDTTLQKVYSEVLTKEGFTVTTASAGKEALAQLKQSTISLILLDIMLPGGMNGFDILTEIKRDEHYKEIPVIVLTNLDSEKQTAIDYGAADYFFKANMDIKTLLEKIKNILR